MKQNAAYTRMKAEREEKERQFEANIKVMETWINIKPDVFPGWVYRCGWCGKKLKDGKDICHIGPIIVEFWFDPEHKYKFSWR